MNSRKELWKILFTKSYLIWASLAPVKPAFFMPKTKDSILIRNLESRLKTLEKEKEKHYIESEKRGVELEELIKIIAIFRNQLNKDFLRAADETIMKYRLRCTDKNGQKRLRNG